MRPLGEIRADIKHTRESIKAAAHATSYNNQGISVSRNLGELRKLLSDYLNEEIQALRRKAKTGPMMTITTVRRH